MMEKFKQTVRMRGVLGGLYCCLVLVVTVLFKLLQVDGEANNFTLGFATGIEAVALFYIVKSVGALRNEEKLKKLYIEENDERNLLIQAKTGGLGIQVILLTLVLAMLIAGYLNRIVFYTLLVATIFISIVTVVLKMYYVKKL